MTTRILLVSDNLEHVEWTEDAEKMLDCRVFMAASCDSALRLIQIEGSFALAIADCNMSLTPGLDFLRQVQALSPSTSRVLTGFLDENLIGEMNGHDVLHDYIKKPVTDENFMVKVGNILKRHLLARSQSYVDRMAAQLAKSRDHLARSRAFVQESTHRQEEFEKRINHLKATWKYATPLAGSVAVAMQDQDNQTQDMRRQFALAIEQASDPAVRRELAEADRNTDAIKFAMEQMALQACGKDVLKSWLYLYPLIYCQNLIGQELLRASSQGSAVEVSGFINGILKKLQESAVATQAKSTVQMHCFQDIFCKKRLVPALGMLCLLPLSHFLESRDTDSSLIIELYKNADQCLFSCWNLSLPFPDEEEMGHLDKSVLQDISVNRLSGSFKYSGNYNLAVKFPLSA